MGPIFLVYVFVTANNPVSRFISTRLSRDLGLRHFGALHTEAAHI